jgi:hypothetical protein
MIQKVVTLHFLCFRLNAVVYREKVNNDNVVPIFFVRVSTSPHCITENASNYDSRPSVCSVYILSIYKPINYSPALIDM